MASTYMNNYRQTCREEKDRKISAEELECQRDVSNMRRNLQQKQKWSAYLQPTGCASVIIGILLMSVLGVAALQLVLIAWPILNCIIVLLMNGKRDEANREIERKVSQREQLCRDRSRGFEAECARKIEAEEKRYRAEVGQARKNYGGSVVMAPVLKWICGEFDPLIKAADRSISVKTITAELRYRVDAHQIVILQLLPHSGTYQETAKVVFDKGVGGTRYHDLPGFFHQVGFAQALSKQIEFETLRRYPQDPVAPARGHAPKVKIDYDDTTLAVTYMVANPNYRSQVSFSTGVRN